MAYKVLSLGEEAQTPVSGYKVLSLGNEPKQLGGLERTSAGTASKFIESAQNIASLPKAALLGLGSLFGMEEPHARLVREGKLAPEQAQGVPDLSQLFQQKLGYTPEQLQPQNATENFIQRFGSQAPINALLGGLPAVASTALGSGVASGAGALGAPEGVQDILQLGSELGYGLGKGRIPTAGSAQKKAYETVAKLAGEDTGSVGRIQYALHEAGKKLGKETTKKVSDEITHALATVEKNVSQMNGQLKVKDALDLRRKLGETYETVSKNAKPYINDVRNSINEFFSDYSALQPKFFKALDKADKLTMMKHQKTVIDKFADLIVDKLPGVVGTTAKAAVKVVLSPTVGKLEKLGKNIISNPVAVKHYLDVAKAASTQNTALFVNSLRKLDDALS